VIENEVKIVTALTWGPDSILEFTPLHKNKTLHNTVQRDIFTFSCFISAGAT